MDAISIQQKLSESLDILAEARLSVAWNLWSAIQLRDMGATSNDPAWHVLDRKLVEQGFPTTSLPANEFLIRCCQ